MLGKYITNPVRISKVSFLSSRVLFLLGTKPEYQNRGSNYYRNHLYVDNYADLYMAPLALPSYALFYIILKLSSKQINKLKYYLEY